MWTTRLPACGPRGERNRLTLPTALASEAIGIALGLGKVLPRPLALRLFSAGGALYPYFDTAAWRRTLRNLRLVYGERTEVEALCRQVYRQIGRNVVDLARLERSLPADLDRLVTGEGYERLDRALGPGRGVIGITGHIGNWELLAAWLGAKGIPLTVMAAKVFSSRLDARLVRLRARYGVRSILRSDPHCLRHAIRVLRRGEMLGLLMDLSSRSARVETSFLGHPARTVAGPVRLAAHTGASLIPMACWRIAGDRFRVQIEEAVPLVKTADADSDVRENTCRCVRTLESFIEAAPSQWVWMHDRWDTGAS